MLAKRISMLLVYVLVLSVLLSDLAKVSAGLAAFNVPIGRREALQKSTASVASGLASLLLSPPPSARADEVFINSDAKPSEVLFTSYKIKPDPSASLNPSINKVENSKLMKLLAAGGNGKPSKGGALWLGEHHNSERDHNLQADFIKKIHDERTRLSSSSPPMAIGLEQVQVQFQGALDDFVAGKISEEKMKKQVEWDKRWVWPFEVYRPVFTVAKDLGIRLVALNVNSEDLSEVEKNGFPGLPRARLQKYITDPTGFAEFARPKEFSTYVDYVIRPSYDLHREMGLLKNTMSGEKLDQEMSFRNFFSGRILWDEAMASAASAWTDANPGGLMVGLVGADHVKFKNGIPGRYARLVGASRDCTSVILNPTLIDTRPSGSVGNVIGSDSSQYPDRITLQLRYLKEGVDETTSSSSANTGGVLSLADYIIVS